MGHGASTTSAQTAGGEMPSTRRTVAGGVPSLVAYGVVFTYRRHDDSITADHLGARRELAHTLERLRREDPAAVAAIGPTRLEAALARHYARIGRTLMHRGEREAAREALDRAMRLRPLHPGHRWRRWLAGR